MAVMQWMLVDGAATTLCPEGPFLYAQPTDVKVMSVRTQSYMAEYMLGGMPKVPVPNAKRFY